MDNSNYITLSLSEEEVGDTIVALITCLDATEEELVKITMMDKPDKLLRESHSLFLERVIKIKDKILDLEKEVIRKKGVPFVGACK